MTVVKIKGMRCGHCVAAVTSALNAIPGISGVSISLEAGEASFNQDRETPLAEIKKAITAIGFEVEE